LPKRSKNAVFTHRQSKKTLFTEGVELSKVQKKALCRTIKVRHDLSRTLREGYKGERDGKLKPHRRKKGFIAWLGIGFPEGFRDRQFNISPSLTIRQLQAYLFDAVFLFLFCFAT
jgi:hypothetical protein